MTTEQPTTPNGDEPKPAPPVREKPKPAASNRNKNDPAPHDPNEWLFAMRDECRVMMTYSSAKGTAIPEEVVKNLVAADSQNDKGALLRAHNTLAKLVEPATPGALRYLSNQDHEAGFLWRFLGPVTTIRFMALASLVSLMFFVGVASSDKVSTELLNESLLDRTGANAIYAALLLIAAAAIGVSFNNLFKARQYVIAGTYDPKYNTTYWMRFVLGLTSGYILVDFIDLQSQTTFHKPLLALVGGFAADTVYNILERIVEGVRTMVRGDIKTRIDSLKLQQKSELDRVGATQSFETAKQLMAMRAGLSEQGATQAQIAEIDAMIKKRLGGPTESG